MFVQPKDRARAIGKNGITLKRSKAILKRHFNIDNVFINVENQKPKNVSDKHETNKEIQTE